MADDPLVTPLLTGYGVPLAEPLGSYDTLDAVFGQFEEENSVNDISVGAYERNEVHDGDMSGSVPGIQGVDYPILYRALRPDETGFTCSDKLLGGKLMKGLM